VQEELREVKNNLDGKKEARIILIDESPKEDVLLTECDGNVDIQM